MIYHEIWFWALERFKHFLLVWLRVGGFFIFMPLFAGEMFPKRFKWLFSFIVAAVLFPTLPPIRVPEWNNLGFFLYACVSELSIGVLIGVCAVAMFEALQFAGRQIGVNMGLAMANVLDPTTGVQVSVLGQMFFFVGFLSFLAMDGHHEILRLARASFDQIPLLGLTFRDEAVKMIAGWPAEPGPDLVTWKDGYYPQLFLHGLLLSAPVMLAVFFITVAMGFMARAAPEMNVFILGFAVRILGAILLVYFAIEPMTHVFLGYTKAMVQDMGVVLRFLGPDAAG